MWARESDGSAHIPTVLWILVFVIVNLLATVGYLEGDAALR